MTANKWFPLFYTANAQSSAGDATTVDSTLWQGVFSKQSYAALTNEEQEEIEAFLLAFYAGCKLLKISKEPDSSGALSSLGSEQGIVCYTDNQKQKFYYAEFDKAQKKHIVTPIVVRKNAKDNSDSFIYVSQNQYDMLAGFEFGEGECRQATAIELKHIRAITDCMRFKTPAVLAIFDNRYARKEALSSSQALLDGLIPDAFKYYDAHQVQHLDEALHFALYQYLAHAQAATDHIGVIRSQHTELASCYRKIKQCTLYRKQLKLRQLELDVQALQHAKDEASKATLIETCNRRYRVGLKSEKDAYQSLIDHQKSLKNDLDKFDAALESLKPEKLTSYLSFLKEDEDELDSDYLLSQLSKGNMRRLYWVWTRCLIEMLIIAAHQMLLVSTMIAAWVSWSLYWFRGSVTAAAAVQHSWDALVSDRERVISSHTRMLAHLEERLDEIANDLVWGSSNFAGCFWLTGIGLLGFIGDLLTLILLGMDLTLATFRLINGQSANEAIMTSYHEQLTKMIDRVQPGDSIKALALKAAYEELNLLQTQNYFYFELNPWRRRQHAEKLKQALKNVELKLSDVKKTCGSEVFILHWETLFHAQQDYFKQWQNKHATLIYDVAYAVILAAGFGLMCFSPVAGVNLFGAVLLVASTVLWRSLYANDDIASMTETIAATDAEYFSSLSHFTQLAKDAGAIIEDKNVSNEQSANLEAKMKQLYLHIRALGAKSGHDMALKRFKQVDFIRDTFMRLVIPVAIALTLLLAPATVATLPTYVFLLLGVLVFALATSNAIHYWLKPKASIWLKNNDEPMSSTPIFNEADYDDFKKLILDTNETISPLPHGETTPLIENKSKEAGQQALKNMQRYRTDKHAQQHGLFATQKNDKAQTTQMRGQVLVYSSKKTS